MAARISNDGMWRVSYGELSGLSRDEVHPPIPPSSQYTHISS